MSAPTPGNVQLVDSFKELRTTPFTGSVNALCWQRTLTGDYAEVVAQLGHGEGIVSVPAKTLQGLTLSPAGRLAVEQMLTDLKLLEEQALAPLLNIIHDCVWSPDGGLVPTEVLSFHVDSAPVEVDTWLCTYHGAGSEGLRNSDAVRKVEQPTIRAALLQEYGGTDDEAFEEWLNDACYDRHYAALPGAIPYPFGTFNLWRIATLWPGSPVLPCIHRAPLTAPSDVPRLLLIS